MAESRRPSQFLRFEGMEIDLLTGELRGNGKKAILPKQPLQILSMLLEHPGEMVTRDEIRNSLWLTDTFVDFDHSINVAVQRLRQALGDSSESPRFIETLARRGYRFIPAVDRVESPRGARESPGRPGRHVAAATGLVLAALGLAFALNLGDLRDRFSRKLDAVRGSPRHISSIAVLPLQNLSGDKDQEYFADGLTDAIITDLGRVGALRVISRQSIIGYQGSRKPLGEIAQELNVDAIVEGTVQSSNGRVRITANLVDGRSDRQIWADAFEHDTNDVLDLESEVAQAIAREIRVKVTPEENFHLTSSRRRVDPVILDLYLRGMAELNRGGNPHVSRRFFEQAIQKDPNFASAYLGMARACDSLGNLDEVPARDAYTQEKVFALKAVQLDDDLDSAHTAIAKGLLGSDWDWAGAEKEIKRALEVNPNSEEAHCLHSFYLSLQDRREESIAEARRAQEIDPASAWPYYYLGSAYYLGRQYENAIVQSRMGLDLDSVDALRFVLFWAYREKGQYKEAIQVCSTFPPRYASIPAIAAHVGNLYARAGRKADAIEILNRLIRISTTEHTGHYGIALIYTALGEKDAAFEWLDKAYRAHDKGLLTLRVDPALDPLRSDARFQELVRRMNFPL